MGTPGRTPKRRILVKLAVTTVNLKFQRALNTMAIGVFFNCISLLFMYSSIKLIEKQCKICVTNFHSPLCFFKLPFSNYHNKTMCDVSSSSASLPTGKEVSVKVLFWFLSGQMNREIKFETLFRLCKCTLATSKQEEAPIGDFLCINKWKHL